MLFYWGWRVACGDLSFIINEKVFFFARGGREERLNFWILRVGINWIFFFSVRLFSSFFFYCKKDYSFVERVLDTLLFKMHY